MREAVGYLGLPVVLGGLWHGSPSLVASGLSFLLGWHALSTRAVGRRARRRRGADP